MEIRISESIQGEFPLQSASPSSFSGSGIGVNDLLEAVGRYNVHITVITD
jgi:hypothetical protein